MRMLVARCSVAYAGRLGAYLAPGVRLVLLKADGSVAIHSDSKAYKPLNWMSPPCAIVHRDDIIIATNPKGETLEITLHEVLHDTEIDLGEDPGLEKDGVEAELQQLLAARVAALREDFMLVRREFPTDIGPIDLLCRDGDGKAVVVEVKRVGEIAGVDQLLRYQERLDRDPQYAPTAGMLVAQQIKPQARVYAESKGVACVEIDLARCAATSTPPSSSSERGPVRAVLLLQCPDRPGIVAAVGAFVAETGGNVVEADQHSDPAAGLFLQRVEFDVDASLAIAARRLRADRANFRDGLVAARPRRRPRRGARVAPGPLPRRPPRSQRAR